MSSTIGQLQSMMGGQTLQHRTDIPGPCRRGAQYSRLPMASRLGAGLKKTIKDQHCLGRVPVKTADRQLRANA